MSDLFPETMGDASYDDQLKEIDRELAMRKRLYPGWVAKGTLKQSTADRQIAVMQAVHETVRKARQTASMTTMSGKRIE